MKRNLLKELKDFHNEILRKNCEIDKEDSMIKNFSQFQIINYLLRNRDADTYQKDFEGILQIRKSTISGILNTMEKNKIISRSTSNSDGRGKIIKLTDRAVNEYEKITNKFKRLNDDLIKGIEESELNAFFHTLDKMKHNLER